MTIEITRESFTKAMRDAVAERGKDYRYDSRKYADFCYSTAGCHYVTPEGAPDCLIGAVLANLGHPLPEFSVAKSARLTTEQVRHAFTRTIADIDPRFGRHGEAFDNWLQEVLEIERSEAYDYGYDAGFHDGEVAWD